MTELENAIAALEKSLGISVTIVDYQGTFRTGLDAMVFSSARQSHRKNPVCEYGFCENCVEHCRHAMNAQGLVSDRPFVGTCWKGVTELVVPMNYRGRHLGMFYAGSWRLPSSPPPEDLPDNFHSAWLALPEFNIEAECLLPILRIFVGGILNEMETIRTRITPPDSTAARIQVFFLERAEQGITLNELATHLGLSRSRASFLLSKHFGKSFPAMLHEERIARAAVLLTASELKIMEIAEKTGFSDANHFSKVFRRIKGITPGEFRGLSRGR